MVAPLVLVLGDAPLDHLRANEATATDRVTSAHLTPTNTPDATSWSRSTVVSPRSQSTVWATDERLIARSARRPDARASH